MQVFCAPVQIKYRTSTSKQNIYYKHLLEKTQTHTHTQTRAHNYTHIHTQAGVWHNRLHISAKGQQSPQIKTLSSFAVSPNFGCSFFQEGSWWRINHQELFHQHQKAALWVATSNVTHAGEGGLIFTVTVAQFSFAVFQPPSTAPPSLPSPPITPNPVEYCWRESVEFKVTVGGQWKRRMVDCGQLACSARIHYPSSSCTARRTALCLPVAPRKLSFVPPAPVNQIIFLHY